MAGVIGVDIGSSGSMVAVVRKGVVDIVRNDISERVTPSLVAFTEERRHLGEAVLSSLKSNYANTCRNCKLLLGSTSTTVDSAHESSKQLCALGSNQSGEICYSVGHLGKDMLYTPTEVTSMLMTNLFEVTEKFSGLVPRDIVMAVPSYFTDRQRRCLVDACEILGLSPLRIMNDHAAISLQYGIYRSAQFDEKTPTNVVICSMGHSHFSCFAVSFTRSSANILAERTVATVGGSVLDQVIIADLAARFQATTKLDVLQNPKARIKLEEAVSKAKKILSANQEAPVNVDCIMNERDLSFLLKRADVELIWRAHIEESMRQTMDSVVSLSGLSADQISAVELVGSSSRVPLVQQVVSEFFGNKQLSFTLLADECVARGCALAAAILSPLYRVREFVTNDYSNSCISVAWRQQPGQAPSGNSGESGDSVNSGDTTADANGVKKSVVFARRSQYGTSKQLTFWRYGPFELEVAFDSDSTGGYPWPIAKYVIDVPVSKEAKKVTVRVCLTLSGIFMVDYAQMTETEEYEEVIKEPIAKEAKEAKDSTPSKESGDSESVSSQESKEAATSSASEPAYTERTVKKTRQKKTDLVVHQYLWNGLLGADQGYRSESTSDRKLGYMTSTELKACQENERKMAAIDAAVIARDNARNSLEAAIYSVRDNTSSGDLSGYITDAERAQCDSLLNELEDWLYSHDVATIEEYIAKHNMILTVTKPARDRKAEVDRANAEIERKAHEAAAALAAAAAAANNSAANGGSGANGGLIPESQDSPMDGTDGVPSDSGKAEFMDCSEESSVPATASGELKRTSA